MTALIVVMPPDPRGLRHFVDPAASYERTYCGRNPDLWAIDIKGGAATCVRCQRTAEIKGYAHSSRSTRRD
jgi:hypothetical protein